MIENIWYLHPYSGGPGLGNSARPFHLASAWNRLQRRVTVFCSSWHHLITSKETFSGNQVLSGVHYCFVPARQYHGNGLSRLLNMFDYCRGLLTRAEDYAAEFGKPDMIIVSSPHPYSIFVGKKLAKRWQAKLVFEVRDLWPLSLTELAGVSKWHPLALFTAWVEHFAYRNADAIVSLLPGAKQHMVKRGLPPGNFHYIPNGASFHASLETRNVVVEAKVLQEIRAMLAAGHFVIVYPGAMGPPNNMQPLMHAARILSETGERSIRFVLMGQGGELATLQEMKVHWGLDNVHFFPQDDRSVALALMAMASAGFVSVRRLPIYRHGISFNKLFEYMQLALPVIFAADVPGNPVELSACGIITSPDEPKKIADAIRRLASLAPGKRASMGDAGSRFVREFHDYDALARQYLDIFEKP